MPTLRWHVCPCKGASVLTHRCAHRSHSGGVTGMAGKPGRRGWGYVRRLPNKSRRWQASYVGPDVMRHYAPHTFSAKMDAEHWLSSERRLIERDEWTPPAQRAAERRAKSITLGAYFPGWLENRHNRRGE